MPSVAAATGRAVSAAARNCTAVTATGSRPGSRRAWATVNEAENPSDARTSPSPAKLAPPPPPTATRPTPANDTAKPVQATGGATLRCRRAAMTATSTGVAPMSRAAWLTLVRVIPAFCTRIDPPYPTAPQASTAGLAAPRTRNPTAARSTAAARPNRAMVSQPGGSHWRASLVTGTVATLHRVRRLKESGVIRVITARLDPAAAGFPLHVYVAASLARHDPRSSRVFEDQVRALPQITAADNVAGEMDYLLTIVARDVAELQQVLARLATRGGQRLLTYLRLEEIKPPSPLPLTPTPRPPSRTRRAR
jgi:Lrp/AsnC family transcriptional regulator, leucine-responsive regulatory protein